MSEVRGLLLESQRELLKLLKPKTREIVREEDENTLEDESKCFYSPTRSVRENSNQNNDPCRFRNKHGRTNFETYFREDGYPVF